MLRFSATGHWFDFPPGQIFQIFDFPPTKSALLSQFHAPTRNRSAPPEVQFSTYFFLGKRRNFPARALFLVHTCVHVQQTFSLRSDDGRDLELLETKIEFRQALKFYIYFNNNFAMFMRQRAEAFQRGGERELSTLTLCLLVPHLVCGAEQTSPWEGG